MNFPNTIYENPVVPTGYYYARCRNVITEHVAGADRPRIWVELELGPMHREHAHKRFCIIIHPSQGARFIFANFVNSYRIAGANYVEAIGRWAAIQLYPAEYGGTRYSAVKFCHQLAAVRRGALVLEEAERRYGQVTEAALANVQIAA